VLAHLRPEADIPVLQLSINALKPLTYHLELGAKLAQLRAHGVILLGSGNVVHNLGRLRWDEPDKAFERAARFDEAVVDQLRMDPSAILKVVEHPDYKLAVPTADHFIPMLYMAGVAAASGEPMEPLLRGYSMGSLSMTCYGIGTGLGCREEDGAATLPADVPAEQTNI